MTPQKKKKKKKPTNTSLLGVNSFRIDGRRHFGGLSKSAEDDDGHESSLDLSRANGELSDSRLAVAYHKDGVWGWAVREGPRKWTRDGF